MNVIPKHQHLVTFLAGSIRLPLHIRFAVCLLVGIIVSLFAIRLASPQSRTAAFSDLSDLIGADAKQMALARGFVCKHSEFPGNPQSAYDLCTREDSNGIFTRVTLQTLGSDGEQISFLLRGDTVKLGDLVLLWGKPEVRHYCEAVIVRWSARHIIGIAPPTPVKRVSYLLPIRSVIVSRDLVPSIDVLMTMQLPGICAGAGF